MQHDPDFSIRTGRDEDAARLIALMGAVWGEYEGIVFDVDAEAEKAWGDHVLATHVDATSFLATCTPSRLNNEGHPELMNPRNTNYGYGFGDWFEYRELVRNWIAAGDLQGLEIDEREPAP